MKDINTKTIQDQVSDYNSDCERAVTKAVTYGSLQRPRATLADIAGLTAANDNHSHKEQ